MELINNVQLKKFNSFQVESIAKKFIEINSESELEEILEREDLNPFFILGGGSNLLFTKDICNTVLKINLKGIEFKEKQNSKVEVSVGAGENWHEFVMWTVEKSFSGLENLSLIPGNVGASPIQNIGAYGVEAKDRIIYVEFFNIDSRKKEILNNKDCKFGYRNSIFKNELKGKVVITKVVFELFDSSNFIPNLKYGGISKKLDEMGISEPKIKDVSDAIVSIREEKLPNPKIIGNAGSFFKNPVVENNIFKGIINNFPNIPHYEAGDSKTKIPAAWLIENSGFDKNKEFNSAKIFKNHSLVLTNGGNASGNDVLKLANEIKKVVLERFNIELEFEVNII